MDAPAWSWPLALLLLLAPPAPAATLVVTDGDATARVSVPVATAVDLATLFGADVKPAALDLAARPDTNGGRGRPLPVQFVPTEPGLLSGELWWLLPPGPGGERRFELTRAGKPRPTRLRAHYDSQRQCVDVTEADVPVLRYNHGTVPVRAGVEPAYARGDYISPLYGPDGEELTEDYPKDHPHHRAVSWSWPVVRWGNEVRDLWAVRGIWARPVAIDPVVAGSVVAVVRADSAWKWGDKTAIVHEEVTIRAFAQMRQGRFVDVDLRLVALEEGVAIGGRPKAGYGGFGFRAAAAEGQTILLLGADGTTAQPPTWIDYSARFTGGRGRTGVAIFQHVANPGYPSKQHEYASLNYVMPALPGARELPLPKGATVVLRHRLWIHRGTADAEVLAEAWTSYARPPTVALVE